MKLRCKYWDKFIWALDTLTASYIQGFNSLLSLQLFQEKKMRERWGEKGDRCQRGRRAWREKKGGDRCRIELGANSALNLQTISKLWVHSFPPPASSSLRSLFWLALHFLPAIQKVGRAPKPPLRPGAEETQEAGNAGNGDDDKKPPNLRERNHYKKSANHQGNGTKVVGSQGGTWRKKISKGFSLWREEKKKHGQIRSGVRGAEVDAGVVLYSNTVERRTLTNSFCPWAGTRSGSAHTLHSHLSNCKLAKPH